MPVALADMESPAPEPPLKVPEYGFVVSHQKLELEVDFSTQSISGRTTITILPQTADLREIKIDARQCTIEHNGVRVNGSLAGFDHEDPMEALNIPTAFQWNGEQHDMQRNRISPLVSTEKANGSLEITIPGHIKIVEVNPFSDNAASAVTSRALGASAARSSSVALDVSGGPISAANFTPKTAAEQAAGYQPLDVSISFSVKNFREGLQFVGVAEGDSRFPHVYTRHSVDRGTSSCIFPCIDDPAMRCTWDISIKCSRTLGDALKPRTVPDKALGLQQLLSRRGVSNVVSSLPEDYEVPLSEDEKIMELAVVCSGEQRNETTDKDDSSKKIVSFECRTIVAPQHIGFAIGPFEIVDLSEFREVEDDEKLGQGQTIPVTGYCLPGRADDVRITCTPMAQGLDWFLLNFGGYPFSDCRFVFVDDQVSDTAHAASVTFCSNRLLYGEEIKDTQVETTRTLIHAIASQWMGVCIVPNAPSDRWITVGVSHFMTDIFMKILCGNNEHFFRQKTLSDKLVNLDIDRPSLSALGEYLHLGQFALEFMTLKAPLVLFILDKRIVKTSGSVGMIRVISKLITAANTGSSVDSVVSTDEFRRLVEKVTKYRQTEPFWKQWIEGAGCPRFTISQKFNKKRLVIEMTISQKQDTLPTQRILEKDSFLREVKEEVHGVYAAELQPVFTGPMTIRIYEADGTPYDHVLDIRDGTQKFDIPYNTKYKRLKRSRRQKERMNLGHEVNADGGEEVHYHSLGDVLSSAQDMRDWGLQDWDADTEQRMEQESYEWIRVDADFEWLAEKQFMAMPAYMYVSQLQQDRDVVAQQDSMMYLGGMNSHPLVATFLVRTLMDDKYFHGIRTMAAEYLKTHATKICGWVGLKHLEKAYQFFSCNADGIPKPNDFSYGNEKTYKVEMAIIKSLSKVRDIHGKCPKEARHFLADLLRFNDNSNNEFSDNFKLATLLSALTESLIPVKDQNNVLEDNEEDYDPEPEDFKASVLQELDRYRRMDEWSNSYQNIFTVTVLECKARLMKANVIPVDGTEFSQYLHDGNGEHIRIKAFESLIDLGFLKNPNVAALLLNCLSTDRSPYTRCRLFEVFCLGLASIAFGEVKPNDSTIPPPHPDGLANGNALNGGGMILDGEQGGLIIEQDASLEARKADILRTTTVEGAIAALKVEMKDNQAFKDALWDSVKSTSIGVSEQGNLLDICSILYDAVESLIVRMPYPRVWNAEVVSKGVIRFKKGNAVRIKVSKHYQAPEEAKPPPPPVVKLSFSNASSTLGSAIVVAKPFVPNPVVPPTPKPPPTKIVFNNMKPPKRPAENSLSSEERPAKQARSRTIKLKVNGEKLRAIVSKPPNPARPPPMRSSSSIASLSPSRSSPGPRPSVTPSPSSTLSNGTITAAVPPYSKAHPTPPLKIRKPLPDGLARKPLPDKTARKPLPGGTPSERKALPSVSAATPSTASPVEEPKKRLVIKLHTGKKFAPNGTTPSNGTSSNGVSAIVRNPTPL